MLFKKQVEIIKLRFNDCDTNDERAEVFMMFASDLEFDRGAITTAMKETGINNDFSITQNGKEEE